jgi:hypothetical protein
MKYVEYDENGHLFHICEALISPPATGPSPALSGGTQAEIDAWQKQIDDHLAYGRSLQLASLIDSHQKIQAATPLRGVHVLADTDPMPTHEGHIYDHSTSQVRAMTAGEKKAWQAANPKLSEPPSLSDEDVVRVAKALRELG